MKIEGNYFKPIREDIDDERINDSGKITGDLKTEPYVAGIKDKIDSLGVRFKLSINKGLSNDELVGFTIETGFIFSEVGKPSDDFKLLERMVKGAFAITINYISNLLPENYIKDDLIEKPPFKDIGGLILLRLIELGFYD